MSPEKPTPPQRLLRLVACSLLGLLGALFTAYGFGAIYYDAPFGPPGSEPNQFAAIVWLALLTGTFIAVRRTRVRIFVVLVGLGVVLLPWSLKRPSNDRDWQPEFARTGWVERDGDTLTFHHVRNFAHRPFGPAEERWETRTHHLSSLRGIDYFHDAFGGDWLAHPILSFDFGEEGRLCLSVETRREKSESFSALGGLFKMFELQYLFGTEEDFIHVRTNVRNEPVFLYRTRTTPEQAREVLLESIATQNRLREEPRFYNVVTANCTTSLRAQTPAQRRAPFDWRLLVNGRLDELVHERGAFLPDDLSFPDLRERALINAAARVLPATPDFSHLIRLDRPGFPPADGAEP